MSLRADHRRDVGNHTVEGGNAAYLSVCFRGAPIEGDAELIESTLDELDLSATGEKHRIGIEHHIHAALLEVRDHGGEGGVKQCLANSLHHGPAKGRQLVH